MKHILLVDDDPSFLRVMNRALGLMNYRVTTANSGPDALTKVDAYQIDLLVTDYKMPKMTGRELITEMRQQRAGLKALVVTGFADDVEITDPEWWESQVRLNKPFPLASLKSAVENLVGPSS